MDFKYFDYNFYGRCTLYIFDWSDFSLRINDFIYPLRYHQSYIYSTIKMGKLMLFQNLYCIWCKPKPDTTSKSNTYVSLRKYYHWTREEEKQNCETTRTILSTYYLYLVRDINSPIYFHQSTKIWCYDYFNDAVKCILMPPQDLEN